MEKVSFDIILNLKNNITGVLSNVKKMFDNVEQSAEQANSTANQFSNLVGRLKVPDINLNLKNNVSGTLNNVKKQFDGIDKSAQKVCSTTSRLGSICNKLKMPDVNALLGVTDRLGGVFGELSQDGMAFGQSMADLSSITGIVGDDLKALEENARKLGKDSGLGADTAARAYAILASQIDVATIGMSGLNNLQSKSVTLAQASGMSIDAAATSLAGTINQFGLSADESGRVINVLAAGSKYGAAEIEELSQSFKVVGSAASAMGLTVEQSAGALEVLSKANLKGSEAGTALRNIILKLNTELGVDLSKTSLSTALDGLKPRLTDATYLSKLFGMENVAAAQYLIQNANAIEEMTAKVTDTNVAQEQAAIRTQTTAHQMEVLRAKVDDIKIGIAGTLGGFSAWAAVLSENSLLLVSLLTVGKEAVGVMGRMGVASGALAFASKGAAAAQLGYNAVVALGSRALYIYQMQVLTARAAIVTTTGATKLMNIAMAASPYLLALAGVAALAGGIYLLATRTGEAEKAQKRLDDATVGMQKEITTEQAQLTILFDGLKKAKEGTDEWKRARGRIEEQYGGYLKQLGIEITDVNTARIAYTRLSAAILDTARSRASEKALTSAGDALADKEEEHFTDMRDVLTEKYGEETGGRVFEGIAASIRRGEKEIPERWMKFVRKLDKQVVANNGLLRTTTNPLDVAINSLRQGREIYEKEVKHINAVLGTPVGVSSAAVSTPRSSSGTTVGETPTPETGKLDTLDSIKKKVEELQKAQQTASDADGRAIQQQIVQLEALKKQKEQAMGISGGGANVEVKIVPDTGSLVELEKRLSELKIKQANAPIKQGITFQANIEKLEEEVARAKMLIQFGEPVMVPLDGKPVGDLKAMGEGGLTDGIKGMKLPKMELPMDEPLSKMDTWRKAVEEARVKNEELTESLGGVGSTMGSLGQIIGGAAGQWLQWGANCIQAIAAAIPQITALIGLQGTQAAANTGVAATGAAASVASIPIVGPIMAIAAVASVLAALAAIPFANGGVISGPTLGLMGEYAGAQNNPEVVAPLNKLRSMLQPGGGMGGEVEFIIDGRVLRGVLNKVDRVNQRTR